MMYPKNKQIEIYEFISPFGKLDQKNRWVKKSALIPWTLFEEKYAKLFCENNGAPAKPFRMALGAILIRQELGYSDEETVHQITENPYLQYFIGLHEFVTEPPFASTMMVYFRKRITPEIIMEINEYMFGNPPINPPDSGNQPPEDEQGETTQPNKGTMTMDATCTPADITYPTDIGLLNEAREKLEGIIDVLQSHNRNAKKPRTYREIARRKYLHFTKNRKPSKKAVRKATGQQLGYVSRDLKHVDKLLQNVDIHHLSSYQEKWLQTIKTLFEQQKTMFQSKTHSIANRIVSISQPHVRPIVRGKTKAPVEFGAKVSISLIGGYAFIDKLSWDAYNEESLLIPAVEAYRSKYGCYPIAVLADKIYRNRNNLAFCKEHGIRLSGPRLGRPAKETDRSVLKQQRTDSSQRNSVEGKFGEGKLGYGLGCVKARLKSTSQTLIYTAFFCMNLNKRLRVLLPLFLKCLIRHFSDLAFPRYFEIATF